MILLRFGKAGVLALGLAALAAQEARAADGPTEAEVAGAIARGVKHLKAEQGADGSWSYSGHPLGITALAGLALLENGVDRSDPAIENATKVVRGLATRSDQTYDVALSILFLARVQSESRGANDELIRRLAARLAEGESDGMWTYNIPLASEEEESGRSRSRRGGRRVRVAHGGDNSNTQFALLGVWAASRHEFDANSPLEAIDAHFRKTRNSDGRWGYQIGEAGANAMTCAGLMALAIASARPALAERQSARARGAALVADPDFAAALRAVGREAREIGPGSDIYYLWSLERVCVALGLKRIDGFDWYSTGARELLRRQRDDGGWNQERWGEVPNACLALLFLRKANLAFELDRVLKLPDESKRQPMAAGPVAEAAPEFDPGGDATVTVTGASDKKFPEITVELEVKRPDGSFVLDAGPKDFRVTESGQEMPVLGVQAPSATEAHPITVVLVLDHSRSMEEEDRIGGLKRAVATFVKELPKGSRVAVVAFGSEVEVVCPFTDDSARVTAATDALVPSGATRYYDAVAEALELLDKQPGRRAVLALTDGEDTFSQAASLDTAIAAARRVGIPVHTLGLGSEDEIESGDLQKLASSTRGQYYPARQADQLRKIYEEIATRLRSSFSLVYRTDRKLPDGTLRPVRVYYRASKQAGETAVFIPGMVVPASGWSPLFLGLVAVLSALAALPGWVARRNTSAL